MQDTEVEDRWIKPGMKKYYETLKNYGCAIKVENCCVNSQSEIEKDIKESSLLIITGGNPNMLYKKILPYKSIIEKYQGMIIGESAGAEIFFDNYYIIEENSFIGKQEYLHGLGIINDFYIDVHSINDENYIRRLKRISINENKHIYYVDDESAIIYDTKRKDVICVGNAKLIYRN